MSYMSTTNFALSSLLYPCHLAQAHRAMASTVKRSLPSLKRSLTISPIVSAISTMSSKCFVIFGLRLGYVTHGVIPGQSHTEALGISSPGIDEAHPLGLAMTGELQWSIMSDWT